MASVQTQLGDTLSENILWQPQTDQVQATAMYQFMQDMNTKHDLGMETYLDLWNWSVEELEVFWTEIWDYFDIIGEDRKSTRLNSSHVAISYAVFCLKKKMIRIELYVCDT